MNSFRSKPIGWRYESVRHRLARQGIKTKWSKPGYVGSVHGIPIYARVMREGQVYPVSPEEVKKEIVEMPKKDVDGIKAIEFVEPKGFQKEAFAQFLRKKRKILIFSQPMAADGKLDGQQPQQMRAVIKGYVIPHEVGHFKALRTGKTYRSLAMAEARADANVVGMSPFDKDVRHLVR